MMDKTVNFDAKKNLNDLQICHESLSIFYPDSLVKSDIRKVFQLPLDFMFRFACSIMLINFYYYGNISIASIHIETKLELRKYFSPFYEILWITRLPINESARRLCLSFSLRLKNLLFQKSFPLVIKFLCILILLIFETRLFYIPLLKSNLSMQIF